MYLAIWMRIFRLIPSIWHSSWLNSLRIRNWAWRELRSLRGVSTPGMTRLLEKIMYRGPANYFDTRVSRKSGDTYRVELGEWIGSRLCKPECWDGRSALSRRSDTNIIARWARPKKGNLLPSSPMGRRTIT